MDIYLQEHRLSVLGFGHYVTKSQRHALSQINAYEVISLINYQQLSSLCAFGPRRRNSMKFQWKNTFERVVVIYAFLGSANLTCLYVLPEIETANLSLAC